MKTLRLTLCLCLLHQVLPAQGTIDFTVDLSSSNLVPLGSAALEGEGTFTLDGTVLWYEFSLDHYFTAPATIHGPALPGEVGPLLYTLETRDFANGSFQWCVAPVPGGGPGGDYCDWQGHLNIQPEEIPDLVNGLWYLEINSEFAQAGGRGQITAVPEPSTALLLGLSVTGMLLLLRGSSARSRQRRLLLDRGVKHLGCGDQCSGPRLRSR